MTATWKLIAALGLGVLIGARFRGHETACCARIADAARDKVGKKLGTEAQAVGDALNVWGLIPGVMDTFGVST